MATISELEKERAQLLNAIESQAKQNSAKRGDAPGEQSLSDFLNAAESVMPSPSMSGSRPATRAEQSTSSPSPTARPRKSPARQQSEPAKKSASAGGKNKASFFGVIIMLSLLLTVLGVLYITYITLDKELKIVAEQAKSSNATIKLLEDKVAELEKTLLDDKHAKVLASLQTQVTTLETTVKERIKGVRYALQPTKQTSPLSANGQVGALLNQQHGVENAITSKLQTLLAHLSKNPTGDQQADPFSVAGISPVNVSYQRNPKMIADGQSGGSGDLAMTQPVTKRLDQRVFSLVKAPPTAVAPVTIEVLPVAATPVTWLLAEPKLNFTLQLASMPDKHSVKKIQQKIAKQGLSDTKIIPQDRSGRTQYVLVSGSYGSRAVANEASKRVKSKQNISPWIRKFKDLTSKVVR